MSDNLYPFPPPTEALVEAIGVKALLVGSCYVKPISGILTRSTLSNFKVAFVRVDNADYPDGIEWPENTWDTCFLISTWPNGAGFVKEDHWEWRMETWRGFLQECIAHSPCVGLIELPMNPVTYLNHNNGIGVNGKNIDDFKRQREQYHVEMKDLREQCRWFVDWQETDEALREDLHEEYRQKIFDKIPFHYQPWMYQLVAQQIQLWVSET